MQVDLSPRRPQTNERKMSTADQLGLFARGVVSTLKLWTALSIALDVAQRTDESPLEIRTRLAEELVDAFESGAASTDKVEVFLREFVDGELDVVLEDDSEIAIAKELSVLWRDIHLGKPEAQLAVSKLEESAARRAQSGRAQYQRAQGEDDGDSDSSEGDDDDQDAGEDTDMQSQQQQQQQQPVRERLEPVVDEDGFETVQRKRR